MPARILILMLIVWTACKQADNTAVNKSEQQRLKSQYSVPLLIKSPSCEGALELVNFFGKDSFVYRELCLGHPEQKIIRQIEGRFSFVNDSIISAKGKSDHLLLRLINPKGISILELNGKKLSGIYTLGYDTTNYSFK